MKQFTITSRTPIVSVYLRETHRDNSSNVHSDDYVSFKIISRDIITRIVRADKRACNTQSSSRNAH